MKNDTKRSDGYLESLSALALQFTLASYTHEWSQFYNICVIYVCMYLVNRKSAFLIVAAGVFALYFGLYCETKVQFGVNLACYYVATGYGLTFCDRIILTQLLSNYTDFGIEKLLDNRVVPTQMITVDTQVFLFMPWVFLLCITIGGKIAGI